MAKMRYIVLDTTTQEYLASFHIPVATVDAAVTNWTPYIDLAMKFPGVRSAKNVARWLDGNRYGGCVVLNAKGDIV